MGQGRHRSQTKLKLVAKSSFVSSPRRLKLNLLVMQSYGLSLDRSVVLVAILPVLILLGLVWIRRVARRGSNRDVAYVKSNPWAQCASTPLDRPTR
jgi:hypothetical protein